MWFTNSPHSDIYMNVDYCSSTPTLYTRQTGRKKWVNWCRLIFLCVISNLQMQQTPHLFTFILCGSCSPPLDCTHWLPCVNHHQQKWNKIKCLEQNRQRHHIEIHILDWMNLSNTNCVPFVFPLCELDTILCPWLFLLKKVR